MTLEKTGELQSLAQRFIPEEQDQQEDVPFTEKLSAAFATENTVGAFLARDGTEVQPWRRDFEYNAFDDLTEEERLDDSFLDLAVYAENPQELDSVRRQISRERAGREKLSGFDGVVASIAAGTLDPINFIPVGGAAVKTYKTGGSILKSSLSAGGIASGTTAAQELLLHSQQSERTIEESALNITGAALIGGTIGGLSSVLSKADIDKLASGTDEFTDINKPFSPDSAGAASVWEEIRVKGKAAENLTKNLGFDPLSRILTGKSQQAKRLLVELAENPIDVDGYTGQAIESLAKVRRDSLLYRGLSEHRSIFKEFKKGGGELRIREFNELVSKEVRNPGSTGNDFAKRSADLWVKEVYEPQFKASVESRLLGDDVDVTTAKRYLNRVWNKNKVAGNLPRFLDTTTEWLRKQQPDLEDPEDIARQIAGRIISTPDGVLPYSYKLGDAASGAKKGGNVKGPFKSRVFDIPDDLVEDFLENDIEQVAGRYLRQTSTDIEILKRFGSPNDSPEDVLSFTAAKKNVQDEFISLAKKAKTEKERVKIEKEMQAALRDLNGVIDRLRGTYEIPDPTNILHRAAHAARNLNFLRFMGGVTVSSFPDTARLIMSDGIVRSFGTAIRPLTRGLKASKMTADDVRSIGIGTDAITGGRMEVISDINDYALGGTAFERGLQSMANSFGNINLMNQWTSLMKVNHAISMQSKVIDDLAQGKVDPRLRRLGVSESDAKDILAQVQKHGQKDGNAWIYNARAWDDQDLAQKWAAALKKENDRVILVPGQEKPLFMSRETGKTFLQFKSFMLSATQRILIAGIQGQDAHMIQGLTAMIGLGGLTYAIKQIESGRPVSDDPAVWVSEGIDRSGALGILMEANNSIEKISSNNLGLRPLIGASEGASRYASRSATEAILGPTFGSALDSTMRVANAATSEFEWQDSDTSSVRRLLPYQNLFIIRNLLNQVEEVANEAIE